jgi:glycosyltransferase involved in cell wall biosynthesis
MSGLVVTMFNHSEYIKRCLASLRRAAIPDGTLVVLIDHHSTEVDAIKLFDEFHIDGCEIIKIRHPKNYSVEFSLKVGFDLCFAKGCTYAINLYSDTMTNNLFIKRIIALKQAFPHKIVSDFNSKTLNKKKKGGYSIISKESSVNFKSVSGVNMCIEREQYEKYVLPALEESLRSGKDWAGIACHLSETDEQSVAVIQPPVTQHLCLSKSSDFKLLSLPEVTLIQTGCINLENLLKAADACCKDIEFGAVKILTSLPSEDNRIIKIPHINSMQEYSQFCFKELHKFVDTKYILNFHPDGYVLNASAWRNEWLNYDYIGSVWPWLKDDYRVGNGGFSLRSRRLLKAIANDDTIVLKNDDFIQNFAEDYNVCRIYRPYLEERYNIKFAPEEEAERFAIEAYGVEPPLNKYKGQFGFHGVYVDFSDADLPHIPYTYPNLSKEIKYPQNKEQLNDYSVWKVMESGINTVIVYLYKLKKNFIKKVKKAKVQFI